ncbi:Exopolyphosphatase [hydrothermal vent metagenome]|uniref:Exopolyphosphatase n=1 Tax=hydrothermal vent metagenome TaxID=652676 RepID=A0A3B1CB68_9ZZZZ
MSKNYKLAALDIGTNSFHLIVVSVTPSGDFEIIDEAREVIRLSEGSTEETKVIKPESVKRGVEVIHRFQKIANSHGVELRAVATSAVREANNKDEFLKTVFEKTGVKIEIINGVEEAQLIYLGILKALPISDKYALAVDIGGGSTEFILGKGGKVELAESIKIGAVRLTQKFFPDLILTEQRIDETRNFIRDKIAQVVDRLSNSTIEIYVGSSGTIMNVGSMIAAKRNGKLSDRHSLNKFEFSAEELFDIENEVLNKRTAEEREEIPGLEIGRGDIIPAGVIILSIIFRMFKIDKMIIAGYALREGIILDSMDKLGIS